MLKKNKKLFFSLEKYFPTNKIEQANKNVMLSFLRKNHNCLKRTSIRGHFTASAWVVNSEETHVLLMHHKKLNIWIQLGGHADGENDLLNVAIKEVLEESGIKNISPITDKIFDIGVHRIPRYQLIKEHYHYDIRFLLKSTSDDTLVANEESTDLKWFLASQASLPTKNQDIQRMLSKWLAFKRI